MGRRGREVKREIEGIKHYKRIINIGAPNSRAVCHHKHLKHIKWSMYNQPHKPNGVSMYPVCMTSWKVCRTEEHDTEHTVSIPRPTLQGFSNIETDFTPNNTYRFMTMVY
jgi:hypothetical protein